MTMRTHCHVRILPPDSVGTVRNNVEMKQSHECLHVAGSARDMHMLVCGHTSQSMITITNIADESVIYAC